MLFLSSTSDKISLNLSPGVNHDIHASYIDHQGATATPGSQDTKTTIETDVDVVGAPASGVHRSVKTLHVRNVSGSPSDVTVIHKDGTTDAAIHKVSLQAGWSLSYVEGEGFQVFDADGVLQE